MSTPAVPPLPVPSALPGQVSTGQGDLSQRSLHESRHRDVFGPLKIVVVVLGMIATVVVWIPSLSASDHATEIATVRLTKDLNDTSAQGAPQQSMVAGWATVDFLELVTTQLDETHAEQRRQSSLLFIAIVTGSALAVVHSLERQVLSREKRLVPQA